MNTFHDFLFAVLFGGVASLALVACCYLLWRRANVFAPDIMPPLRLRRYTAAFFAAIAASHLWWLFIHYAHLGDDTFTRILICTSLDILTTLPAVLCTMQVMLQDRRRPLWPVAAIVAIALVAVMLACSFGSTGAPAVVILFLVMLLSIMFVMLRAVRQYGLWLRSNYADMEHKEVWQTFIVMAVFLLISVVYNLANDYYLFEILIEVVDILLIIFLLWRVETMQTLDEPIADVAVDENYKPVTAKIDTLLKRHCVDAELYLQHDVSLTHLARIIGTNRTYLSQYFAKQGLTYNTYINGLRIEHFVRLYQQTVKAKQEICATDLAFKSGFRSYSTFSRAFVQAKGQTVTEWMSRL